MLTRSLIFLVRTYQVVVSPLLLQRCRFQPTCSQYAIDSLQRYGTFRGLLMATRRISKCHPFHSGGHDPVL